MQHFRHQSSRSISVQQEGPDTVSIQFRQTNTTDLTIRSGGTILRKIDANISGFNSSHLPSVVQTAPFSTRTHTLLLRPFIDSISSLSFSILERKLSISSWSFPFLGFWFCWESV
uniref:Putative ovule protein n=1 Tax=Solanum chacoense TaxID=4108 RepID=A0A0V0GSG4_SOLCH